MNIIYQFGRFILINKSVHHSHRKLANHIVVGLKLNHPHFVGLFVLGEILTLIFGCSSPLK